jgi:ferredoxin-type protein NapH
MFWTGVGVFLFGLIITLGMTLRQPFCRICPMLALHAVFRKVGLPRLVKQGHWSLRKMRLVRQGLSDGHP